MKNGNNNQVEQYEDTLYSIPRYIRKLCQKNLVFIDVYEAMFQFWNKGRPCFLSNESLAQRASCKMRQVQNALEFFEKNGELRRENRGLKRFLIKPEARIETNITQACIPVHHCTEITQACIPVQGGVHSSAWGGCIPVHPEYNEEIEDIEFNISSTKNQSAKNDRVVIDPPTILTVPPDNFDGTPPTKVADINIKETEYFSSVEMPTAKQYGNAYLEPKRIEPKIEPKTSPSSKEKNKTFVFDEITDQTLLRIRRESLTNQEVEEEEFLKMCKAHIENRDKTKYNQQQSLAGLRKLIAQGRFEAPASYQNKKQEVEIKKTNGSRIQYQEYCGRIKADICLNLLPKTTKLMNYEEWMNNSC